MRLLTRLDKEGIINLYINGSSINSIAKQYSIGDRRVKQILCENNIAIKDSHTKTVSTDDYIEKSASRFPTIEGKTYVAVLKNNKEITFNDYLNKSGVLTQYIHKNFNQDIPSLFLRKKFFHEHGFQWYEQWFDIVSIENNKKVKKCPYCNWETIDINNRSGMFLTHIIKEHGISKEQYLIEYPEDKKYFLMANKTANRQMENNEDKFVRCCICGKKLARIDWRHLNLHSITQAEYKEKYSDKTVSNDYSQRISHIISEANIQRKPVFTSKPQIEIYEFIKQNGIKCELNNRNVLQGAEIDIFLPDLKIGIEYNGNFWHTENMGKERMAHLDKTEKCKKNGIKLIQIFEDEYYLQNKIVYSKISHLIGIQKSLPRVMGRKCIIKNILAYEAKQFLETYHIQGFVGSSVYKGAFYNNELIAVMSFKTENNGNWELTRFASNDNYICQGIGGKIFASFINEYNPVKIKSFADRRWTINEENNLYIQIGFKFDGYLYPDYKYYNNKVDRYRRFHKFGFRKQILNKRYGLPLTMTESEMTKELGYHKIWDCGLIKYVWNRNEK